MQPWTIQIGDIVIGGPGNPLDIARVDGIAAAPEVVSSNRSRVRRHGMVAGDVFATQRTWSIDVTVEDPGWAHRLSDLRRELTVAGDEQPVWLHLPGVADLDADDADGRMVMARPVAFSTEYVPTTVVGIVGMAIQFESTDPRIYGPAREAFLAVPEPTGGVAFPVMFPITFGAGSATGDVAAQNEGTFEAEWSIDIHGPCVNPSVQNLASGERLTFVITLGVGDVLTLSSDMRSVVLNGTANRYYTITADSPVDWWALPPGETGFRYQAGDVGGVVGNCVLRWRSAWI